MIADRNGAMKRRTHSDNIASNEIVKNYWRDYFDTNAVRFPESPLRQVDRTLHGKEEDPYQTGLTVDAVVKGLGLADGDRLLDIGCGNGLITDIVAAGVSDVIGIDFSERLIEYARTHRSSNNVTYYVGDASKLDASWYRTINKACMLGGLQYLGRDEFAEMLLVLATAPRLERIFISAIPDASKIHCYYDNDQKMAYHLARQAMGRPHMGNWWNQDDIRTLAREVGFIAELAPQDERFISAYYRFDCVLWKNR